LPADFVRLERKTAGKMPALPEPSLSRPGCYAQL